MPDKDIAGRQEASAYDHIAADWYRLRRWTRFRSELEEMSQRWKGGSLLNVGCAHGPDFLPFRQGFQLYGIDSSVQILRFGRRFRQEQGFCAGFIAADARRLPFRDCSFDHAIAVAAYHCIEGRRERLEAYRDLGRVLKPGGEAFITAWNRWQRRFHSGGQDVTLPWKTRGGPVLRYYHLYSWSELARDLEDSGLEVLRLFPEKPHTESSPWSSQNICALVKKPARHHTGGCQGEPLLSASPCNSPGR